MSQFFANLLPKGDVKPPAPIPYFPYNWQTNPYRCKKTWPPNFEELSSKHQFSLERRYRRRNKLKWARPNWTKATKLAQWSIIFGVVAYGVFEMDLAQFPVSRAG